MSRSCARSCRSSSTQVRPIDPVLSVDETLLVLDKPAGLLAVPGRGPDKQDCLSERVRQRYPDALVVHRLDMATSGLMLMARGHAAQRALSQQFAARSIHKRYVAIVHGCPAVDAGQWRVIDLPIALDWEQRPRRSIDAATGKPSQSRLRVLGPAGEGRSRVELEPLTGRTHQLRVHLQAIGHPIVGDSLYGLPGDADEPRLLLHASSLALAHPQGGAWRQWALAPRF